MTKVPGTIPGTFYVYVVIMQLLRNFCDHQYEITVVPFGMYL